MHDACWQVQATDLIFRYNRQILELLSLIANMPRKLPVIFPQEQHLLSELGERLRLARKRRKLSNAAVAQRAGISRNAAM